MTTPQLRLDPGDEMIDSQAIKGRHLWPVATNIKIHGPRENESLVSTRNQF